MDRLTKEQIVKWMDNAENLALYDLRIAQFRIICNLALQSLSQESVRSEALRDALDRLLASYKLLLAHKPVRDVSETIAEAERALQSTARVAEGGADTAENYPYGGWHD